MNCTKVFESCIGQCGHLLLIGHIAWLRNHIDTLSPQLRFDRFQRILLHISKHDSHLAPGRNTRKLATKATASAGDNSAAPFK
jgi:hypothetical protein